MKFFRNKQQEQPFKTKKKLGLTLSGGGARGFAHIGAIRAFEEAGITFQYVTGTSVGSIIGACYCAGKTSYEMEEFALTLSDKDLIDSRFWKFGNNSGNISKLVENFLDGATFENLKIPFCCVAVDIVSAREVMLKSGSVSKAVAASSAVPAVFSPVTEGDKILVDGGLLNNIPADVCKQMGAQFVVSVDLNHNRSEGTASLKILDQLAATWRIMTSGTAYKGIISSDVMIEPELRIFKSTTLKNISEMIEEGHRAAIVKMNEIKSKLAAK